MTLIIPVAPGTPVNDDNLLVITTGPDSLLGTNGSDTIDGLAGADTIDGGKGNDNLLGNEGDDTFIYRVVGGNDIVNGGPGNDTQIVIGSDQFDNFVITGSSPILVTRQGNQILSLTAVEALVIQAAGGDDTLDARNYNLPAGLGLDGGDGNDTIFSSAGSEIIVGGNGTDRVDYLNPNSPAPVNVNLITGLATGQGNDTLSGIEQVFGTNFADTLIGNEFANNLQGRGGNDSIVGGASNDFLRGGAGLDTLRGGTEDDKLFGDNGSDQLIGELGEDSLEGGNGNDTLQGNQGNDTLLGGTGNDSLLGGTEDDILDAGAGNDTLLGGAGNDLLEGRTGNDTLNGGNGNDTFIFTSIGGDFALTGTKTLSEFNSADDSILIRLADGSPTLNLIEFATGTFGDRTGVTNNGNFAGVPVIFVSINGVDGQPTLFIDRDGPSAAFAGVPLALGNVSGITAADVQFFT